jgi:hypothetical protein
LGHVWATNRCKRASLQGVLVSEWGVSSEDRGPGGCMLKGEVCPVCRRSPSGYNKRAVRILEPGRKRRRNRLVVPGMWALAAGLATALIVVGALVR